MAPARGGCLLVRHGLLLRCCCRRAPTIVPTLAPTIVPTLEPALVPPPHPSQWVVRAELEARPYGKETWFRLEGPSGESIDL